MIYKLLFTILSIFEAVRLETKSSWEKVKIYHFYEFNYTRTKQIHTEELVHLYGRRGFMTGCDFVYHSIVLVDVLTEFQALTVSTGKYVTSEDNGVREQINNN